MEQRFLKALGLSTFLLLSFGLSAPAAGQTTQLQDAPKEQRPALEKGLRSRIFEVRHRDPQSLLDAVRFLGSGLAGTQISANRDLSTLTVRDLPENLAGIEEALKRLDVPEAKRADIEVTVYLLVGSSEPAENVPDAVKELLPVLRSTFPYKSYRFTFSFSSRVTDGSRVERVGAADAIDLESGKREHGTMKVQYQVTRVSIERSATGPASIHLHGFSFTAVDPRGESRIATDLTIRDGEKAIAGTSEMAERGLVAVVAVKILK